MKRLFFLILGIGIILFLPAHVWAKNWSDVDKRKETMGEWILKRTGPVYGNPAETKNGQKSTSTVKGSWGNFVSENVGLGMDGLDFALSEAGTQNFSRSLVKLGLNGIEKALAAIDGGKLAVDIVNLGLQGFSIKKSSLNEKALVEHNVGLATENLERTLGTVATQNFSSSKVEGSLTGMEIKKATLDEHALVDKNVQLSDEDLDATLAVTQTTHQNATKQDPLLSAFQPLEKGGPASDPGAYATGNLSSTSNIGSTVQSSLKNINPQSGTISSLFK